jgi:signal transduction histidine kinase
VLSAVAQPGLPSRVAGEGGRRPPRARLTTLGGRDRARRSRERADRSAGQLRQDLVQRCEVASLIPQRPCQPVRTDVRRCAELAQDRLDTRVGLLVADVVEGLAGTLDELREIARGIHPAILSEGGLGPALKTLARRAPIPVALHVDVEGDLSDGVEVAAYYAVSELVTNTAKHAQASNVNVAVTSADGVLHIVARDDGIGGADPARGSGLVGLCDRIEALGGTISVRSPKDEGTAVEVALPFDAERQAAAVRPHVSVARRRGVRAAVSRG